ncbi:MAG TPA: S41 family peptidase [Mucilaginibacter sp.]|nr:S41 family peptidase [Mucilaginibacter sp.]
MKIIFRILALLLLLTASVKLRAQSVKDTLSRENKLYALSMIWKEADYNFVFFDRQPHLNWDSLYKAYIPKILATRNVYECVQVLSSFIGTLKDGHTRIMLDQFYWNETDVPPIYFVVYNGKRYITAVDEPLKDEISIGAEITRVNEKSWDDYLHESDFGNNDLRSYTNSTLELTLLSKDNKESKVTLTRNLNTLFRAKKLKMVPESSAPQFHEFEYRSLSPQTAYVDLGTFGDSTIVTQFKQALPDIRKHQALIVDVRNNRGGNDDYAKQIAEYLTDKSYIVGSMWKTRIHNAADKAWAAHGEKSLADYLHRNVWDKHPGDTIRIPATLARLNMPVYILTSKRTFSAAEDFLIYLNYSKNVTRIGQATSGSSGQPLSFNLLPGVYAWVCSKADELPDGTEFINIGIKPQIEVDPASPLSTETKDLELEKALAVIQDAKGK